MTEWCRLEPLTPALQELKTDAARGLSAEEAARRLTELGPNELTAAAEEPLAILWEQMTALMVVILIVAAVASAALGDWKDAIAILTIVILNALLGLYARNTAPRRPWPRSSAWPCPSCAVRRDGQFAKSRRARPGARRRGPARGRQRGPGRLPPDGDASTCASRRPR